jgi:lipoprotein-anchoring transpeptidase ErfK/SrfK
MCAIILTGCVQAIPSDLVAAIEAIDHDLIALRAPEVAPEEYASFIGQWIPLKARVQSEDDLIRWPWESNGIEDELRRLYAEGGSAVARLNARQATLRRTAESTLTRLEERLQLIASQIEPIDGRMALGEQSVQTDLLLKQARSFFEQKDYDRSLHTAEKATHAMLTQTAALTRELGRYADERRIAHWQAMAKQTVEWSRSHQSAAIVVSKADRVLTLYKSGRKVLAYPVRLGFNGIREKQFQGDGATPEGRYRVTAMRGEGQTQFYRALALDYPNAEDRRRFKSAKKAGLIASTKSIGGQIEIHGVENELMAQTLGCLMLDNPHMAALYERVSTGTPVTIVGALTGQNSVALALAHLENRRKEI